jgi:hypothetical protein
MRWLRRWRERDDRHLFKATPPAPLPEIDPIEELARMSARLKSATNRRPEGEGRRAGSTQAARRSKVEEGPKDLLRCGPLDR